MSNNTDILQRGDQIGCYRIEQVLGRGGFAVTYLAIDENLDVEVAIKEYLPREITSRDNNLKVSARKPEFAEDYETGLESFAREAKTLARFKHPHIVRVHQVLHENNTAYMVMDYEHGQELGELLEKNKTLSEDELRNILFPILDGVEEIHRHGFVHRDIKPSNIYIRNNGSPVLIDFGAARYTLSETTQQLTAVVTVGYTPIEQYNVSEDAQGPWSDIYALAAVCYEAVTGDVPIDSVTRASASVTRGDDPLPSVRNQIKGDYSDDCLDAIDWGLRMDAEDRPQVIAQWRDSYDGIFNPASAYQEQKDVSIYSPHRVDKPLRSNKRTQDADRHKPVTTRATAARNDFHSTNRNSNNSEVVSVPLGTTDTPLDHDVVSLDKDSVTMMPSSPRRPSFTAKGQSWEQKQQQNISRVTEHPGTTTAANDRETNHDIPRAEPDTSTSHSNETSTRSKFDRPSHLATPAPQKRTIREEIALDDSDWDDTGWDYQPPKKNSALKLLLPVLGLAAVVGGSVVMVNSPELITDLFKQEPALSSAQELELASNKIRTGSHIFPAGDSALDHYQRVLESDPNNTEAQAGIRSITQTVREQIADNMQRNDVSEANRILARADDAGLRGIYNSTNTDVISPEVEAKAAPVIATTSPVVNSGNDTVISSVDTDPLQPTSQSSVSQSVDDNNAQRAGIDNTPAPFVQERITALNSLIQQQRFTEARALYDDVEKFIPEQSTSAQFLQRITAGEAALAAASATQVVTTQPSTPTPPPTRPIAPEITPEIITPEITPEIEVAATEAPVQIAPTDPPRNSYIDANGPAANHLNRLRLALESKNLDAVQALSQELPEERLRFLRSTFARHDRLDVIIDNVVSSDDTVSGRLNVAMFGRADDGSVYGAGKWNGAIIEATRENGQWQKIRW